MTSLPTAKRVGGDCQITLTAATSYVPGQVVAVYPNMAGIVAGVVNIASGDPVTFITEGKYEFPCASGTTASLGNAAWWDSANSLVVTSRPAAGHYLGRFAKAKTSGQTVAIIDINVQDVPGTDLGIVRSLRRRCTTAEINAGVTLLPAKAGTKYRMVDAAMIAIGGGAATATSVDILATQSASSVKLLASAVAGLTQNTLLRAGASNAAILTGGLSFVANDVNTAITASKTGSDLATATSIDVLLWYVEEAG